MDPHETAFVESFIVKTRRERALELLASSKNRHKLTNKFDHHGRDYISPEYIRPIEPRYQHPLDIAGILRTMGAPKTCHVIGGEHDGEDMELLAALKEIVGYGRALCFRAFPANSVTSRARFENGSCLFGSRACGPYNENPLCKLSDF